jgi:hypothetical protein
MLMQKTILCQGMKFNQYILKGISLFLIVLLMQKTVGGLYLHDWFHTQNNNCTSHELPTITERIASCTCIDDFYTPFAESPEQIIQAVPEIKTSFVAILDLPIPFSSRVFHSLRGPPFAIA